MEWFWNLTEFLIFHLIHTINNSRGNCSAEKIDLNQFHNQKVVSHLKNKWWIVSSYLQKTVHIEPTVHAHKMSFSSVGSLPCISSQNTQEWAERIAFNRKAWQSKRRKAILREDGRRFMIPYEEVSKQVGPYIQEVSGA